MAKPQQPEIAPRGHGATDPATEKPAAATPASTPTPVRGDAGPIPEANQPGHHPDREQDKPSGAAFVQKVRDHARDVPPPADAAGEPSELAQQVARAATTPLRATAGVIRKVRDALPGD